MSIATDVIRENHTDKYQELERIKEGGASIVQDFMDKAILLHNDLTLQEDKDDVIALRDAFVLQLRNILGV